MKKTLLNRANDIFFFTCYSIITNLHKINSHFFPGKPVFIGLPGLFNEIWDVFYGKPHYLVIYKNELFNK